jgi:hypothetical protein
MLCENAGGQGFPQTSHSISQIIDIGHLMERCSRWHVVPIDDRSAIGDPHDVRNVMACRYMDIHQSEVFGTDMIVAPSAVPEQGNTQHLYN